MVKQEFLSPGFCLTFFWPIGDIIIGNLFIKSLKLHVASYNKAYWPVWLLGEGRI